MESGNIAKHQNGSYQPVAAGASRLRTLTPAADIIERKDGVVLLVDMPGVTSESLEVSVEKRVLHISGKRAALDAGNADLRYAEYGDGEFRRQFVLSDLVESQKIEAQLRDGVLRVFLPRSEKLAPRKIEVKAG